MTYKINGVELYTQPTTGRWLPRKQLGIDGNGHPVYSPYHEFEMRWQLLHVSGTSQLQGMFDAVITTGSAVVSLPSYNDTSWNFFAYSGCVLREPELSQYFTQHTTDVTLLVTHIRT